MSSKVILYTCDELPKWLLERHGNITLAVDIMYAIEIPFIITMSGAIHFGISEMMKMIIMPSLKPINNYNAKAFRV